MDRKKTFPPPPFSPDSDDDIAASSPRGSQPKRTPYPAKAPDSDEYTDADDDDVDDGSDSSEDGSSQVSSESGDPESEDDSDDTGEKSVQPVLHQYAKSGVNGVTKNGAVPTKQSLKEKDLKRGREEDGVVTSKRKKAPPEAVMSRSCPPQSPVRGFSPSEMSGKEKSASFRREKEKVAQVQTQDAGKDQSKKGSKQKSEEPQVQAAGKAKLENGSEKKGSKAENEGKPGKKAQKQSESEVPKESLPPVSPSKPKKSQKNSEPEVPKEQPPPASPVKPKKPAQIWTPKDEIAFSSELLNCVKSGSEIPNIKADVFWANLHEQLHGKLEGDWSKDQLCEKARRMKARYQVLADKVKESDKPFKHRNNNDKILFGLWSQVWGKGDEHIQADEEHLKPADGAGHVASVKEGKSIIQDRSAQKVKQPKQETNETEIYTDESDEEGASEGNGTTNMQAGADVFGDGNHKSVLDVALFPSETGMHDQAKDKAPHSTSHLYKFLQDATRASLKEVQESSKRMMDEWQSKATAVVESAVKTMADKYRLSHGMGLAGTGGFGLPSVNNWEHLDFQFSHGEHAFQQQWCELHLQELDVYSQRLQLILQECRLKQDQLKLQLEKGK